MSRFSYAGDIDFECDEDANEWQYFDLFEAEDSEIAQSGANIVCQPFEYCSCPSDCYNALVLNDLQSAITHGDLGTVKRVLTEYKDIDAPLKSGWTPIMHAAYFCQFEVVDYFLGIGADPNIAATDGASALHIACRCSRLGRDRHILETVRTLLRGGSNALLRDSKGRTPLMYAARENFKKVVVTFLQLENVKEILCVKDNQGWTVADWAAAYGHVGILDYLTEAGADVSATLCSFNLRLKHVAGIVKKSRDEIDLVSSAAAGEKYLQHRHPAISHFSHTYSAQSKKAFNFLDKEPKEPLNKAGIDLTCDMKSDSKVELFSGKMAFSESGQSIETVEVQQRTTNVNSTLCTNAANEDSDLCENFNLPVMITQEEMGAEEYEMYGQLELFLLGLNLSHLIPLFRDQEVTFEQVLCLTMEELETIGVSAFGTRKKILCATRECHEKYTKTPNFFDYTTRPLTFQNTISMLEGASKQVLYIANCLRYIKKHFTMSPSALTPADSIKYKHSPIKTYKEKIEDLTWSLLSLSKSLKLIKAQADENEKCLPDAYLNPTGIIANQKQPKGPHLKEIGIALVLSILATTIFFCRRLNVTM